MPHKRTWRDLPLVEVIWTDAAIDTTQEGDLNDEASRKRFGGLVACRDIGYLISKSRTEIKLAVSIFPDDGRYRHSNTIPRRWVRQIVILSRPPETDGPDDIVHHPDDGPADSLCPDLPASS